MSKSNTTKIFCVWDQVNKYLYSMISFLLGCQQNLSGNNYINIW